MLLNFWKQGWLNPGQQQKKLKQQIPHCSPRGCFMEVCLLLTFWFILPTLAQLYRTPCSPPASPYSLPFTLSAPSLPFHTTTHLVCTNWFACVWRMCACRTGSVLYTRYRYVCPIFDKSYFRTLAFTLLHITSHTTYSLTLFSWWSAHSQLTSSEVV